MDGAIVRYAFIDKVGTSVDVSLGLNVLIDGSNVNDLLGLNVGVNEGIVDGVIVG